MEKHYSASGRQTANSSSSEGKNILAKEMKMVWNGENMEK